MSKNANMLGVTFDSNQVAVDSNRSDFYIPFSKTEEYFSIYENEVAFIKKCEDLVRKHSFYATYIKYLINVVGMNTCQVLPGIECTDKKGKVTLEMHHGPILTLYDTCKIVLNYLRYIQYPKITTFKVANIVIEEHRLNNVRVMLVSKTVHQKIHDDSIMLNYNMGFGDTKTFLEKYQEGLDKNYINAINQYIEWSKSNDSFDNDVLGISENMKKFGNNDFDEFDAFTNRRMIKTI